jgi:two-component system cell cycle sensor histidine kinase/response regulator CckA
MRAATSAATSLTNRLLNLGRREPTTAYEPVALGELVTQVHEMSRHALGASIHVVSRVSSSLRVRGSREELQQVITNLFMNARDAMPDGGAIEISAELQHLRGPAALARGLLDAGDYIIVGITDSGLGMTESTMARIFEPFFTTKAVGVGTGLGLSVVHGIVKRHGGAIFVDSVVQRGTTFRIYLPSAGR